jgi:hypothetical protein
MRLILLALAALLMAGCGGGGGPASVPVPEPGPILPLPQGDNVLPVTVNDGPVGRNVNRLYATVTICAPGSTSQCQTIDHVLVDTGSTGLRLLASEVRPDLAQTQLTGAQGFPLLNCVKFIDNTFGWGPVASVDVKLAGKTATSLPVQLMGDPAFAGLAAACPGGIPLDTVASLGGKGVLGVGLFKQDCGPGCTTIADNNVYFTCSSAACISVQPSVASLTQQVANPIARFDGDNNGLLLDLPAADAQGNTSLSGALMFGVGTRANNQLTTSNWLSTGLNGYVTTVMAGKNLSRSFIDTGSNALFFDSAGIPLCPGSGTIRFFCPSSRVNANATLMGRNGATLPVSFAVDNAQTLFASPLRAVLPTLAGNLGDAQGFDWGLPFFYGRRVFLGIEGEVSPAGIGPYYAF